MIEEAVVHRIVLRAPNWLGDAVLALPAMAAVRRKYPDAQVTIAAPASVAPIFREHTAVEFTAVLELPADERGVVAALRAGRFDTCVVFPNSFRSAWQARRAGIPARWGYGGAGRTWLLTRKVRKPAGDGPTHQAEYYKELVRRLDAPTDQSDRPRILASEPSLRRAEGLLKQYGWPAEARFVAIMPGAAYGQAKQWPPVRMAELIVRLVKDAGIRCLLLGATHDRAAAREIESWVRERAPDASPQVLDLVGHTSLGALVGLLARASLCVSNDSGGMHVAAALDRPVVAIFGPTDERITGPLGDHDVMTEPVFCRPCQLRDCPIDHRCMKRITVDRVYQAATMRLGAGAA